MCSRVNSGEDLMWGQQRPINTLECVISIVDGAIGLYVFAWSCSYYNTHIYSVSQKKIPPPPMGPDIFHFFTNGWEYVIDFLHTYYTFLSSLDYKFLFNYHRFRRS